MAVQGARNAISEPHHNATIAHAAVAAITVLATCNRSVRVSGCFNHVSNRSPRRGVRVGTDVPFDWVHGAPHQPGLVSSPPHYWTTPYDASEGFPSSTSTCT